MVAQRKKQADSLRAFYQTPEGIKSKIESHKKLSAILKAKRRITIDRDSGTYFYND